MYVRVHARVYACVYVCYIYIYLYLYFTAQAKLSRHGLSSAVQGNSQNRNIDQESRTRVIKKGCTSYPSDRDMKSMKRKIKQLALVLGWPVD